MKSLLAAALILAAMAPAAQAQDVAAGEQSFKKCLPCHATGEGATNKVGPELNGLAGRHSGSAAGYNYTEANKNSGITWDEAVFKDYIKDPRAKIQGTKMIFPGIKNEKEAGDCGPISSNSARTGKRSSGSGRAPLYDGGPQGGMVARLDVKSEVLTWPSAIPSSSMSTPDQAPDCTRILTLAFRGTRLSDMQL